MSSSGADDFGIVGLIGRHGQAISLPAKFDDGGMMEEEDSSGSV